MDYELMIFMILQDPAGFPCSGWPTGPWNGNSIKRMQLPESSYPVYSSLHPPVDPYACALVDVGGGHRLYLEQCGNPKGMPMVYLHGGPGSACSPRHRQFFDPKICRAVLFDQRGCGRSQPRGALTNNHTDALVQDLETLRQHLGIERWLVVGGSWGAGLALAYASSYQEVCLGLVLRGVFLGRDADIDGFFHGGNSLQSLHVGLHGFDAAAALESALAWEAWEQSVGQQRAVAPRRLPLAAAEATQLVDKYRIQSHYLVNHCFRNDAGFLPSNGALVGLPVAILHGRNDTICSPQAALDLHQRLPGSLLHWAEGCGHDPFEQGNAAALVATIRYFATHANFAL